MPSIGTNSKPAYVYDAGTDTWIPIGPGEHTHDYAASAHNHDSTYIAKTLTTTTGDIIYASAANTPARLGIGSTGQVLTVSGGVPAWSALPASTPSFVGCVVHKSWGTSAQTLPNTTQTVVTFNSELIDTDGYHDNSTNNSRITIPTGKGGKYFIYARGAFDGNANGSRGVSIRKNGSDLLAEIMTWNAGSVYGSSVDVSQIATLNAGDYVEMRIFQSSGGNLNSQGGDFDGYYNTLQVQYLGA